MIDVVWDMETGDPDDFLTLLLLLGHPEVRLKAVTVTPGSPEQIGVVRYALGLFDVDIPVGSYLYTPEWSSTEYQENDARRTKRHVSAWHYGAFGKIPPSFDARPGWEVLFEQCDASTTLITGGPLKNLGQAMSRSIAEGIPFEIGALFAQGGFAGEGVVPADKQLDKFKGKVTCPTWNLGGDPQSALLALQFDGIKRRHFVSKNVCHGVYYDQEMHAVVGAVKEKSRSLGLIWKAMEKYLQKRSSGKKFHDPLAACCAIEPSIASWAEVELYLEKGEWGARLKEGSNTWIITEHKHDAFLRVLTDF